MTLRARGLAALAAGLVAAVAVLGLARLRLRGGVPDAQGRGERVLELAPDLVRAVEVESAGVAYRLVREGGAWRVAAPRPGPTGAAAPARPEPVEERAVRTLLDDVAALTRRATLSDPTSDAKALAPYGLDAPRLRLALAEEGGRTERLALGGGTGEDGAAFAQVTDGAVVVIAASAAAALESDLAAIGAAIGGPAAAPRAGEPAPAPVRPRTGG